jgi:hypothetical protein
MSEPKHWIKIGPNGTFARSGTLHNSPEELDTLLGPALAGKERLLIHLHGGLVDEAHGLGIANAMAMHYGDTACSLSLVWETGILETLRNNLVGVANTKVFKKALSWILAKAMPELGSSGGARGGEVGLTDQAEIEALLQTETGVQALDAALAAEVDRGLATIRARGGMVGEKTEDQLTNELAFDIDDLRVLLDNGEDGSAPILRQTESAASARGGTAAVALFLAKVIIAVVKRYRAGTHHDPLPTAVEELLRAAYLAEIGAFAWSEMKEKSEEMWIDDGAAPGERGHVGGYILLRLEELQKARPALTIDLVGHSAGSIVICAMLAAIKAQNRQIKFRNVLFLAPAVRLDVFKAAVTPPLLFRQFRLFTMTDEAEKADKLVGLIYPRSLLFLVSGLFEDKPGTPLAGLARHIKTRTSSAGASYDDLRGWLADDHRLVLSPSGDEAIDGLRTRAAHHGDFDNDPMTLASLLFLAKAA